MHLIQSLLAVLFIALAALPQLIAVIIDTSRLARRLKPPSSKTRSTGCGRSPT